VSIRRSKVAEAEAFLRAFHEARPGATPRALGHGRLGSGESSYAYLAAVAVRPGVRILDLACGDGHLRAALPDDVAYVGVDISAADLERARQRFPGIDVRCERAQALSLADASVDAVLCHMALMLMDDLDGVLAEVRRVLDPGGVFAAVIGGPLCDDEAFSLFAGLCREAAERGAIEGISLGDRRLESLETIATLFAEHGFDAVVEDAELICDGDLESVWSSLALTYDVAWIAGEERRELERRFREQAAELARPDGSVPFRLCARRITARASAAGTACRETRAGTAAAPRPSGGGRRSD
jgi:SAM-dependent methyltransferase